MFEANRMSMDIVGEGGDLFSFKPPKSPVRVTPLARIGCTQNLQEVDS